MQGRLETEENLPLTQQSNPNKQALLLAVKTAEKKEMIQNVQICLMMLMAAALFKEKHFLAISTLALAMFFEKGMARLLKAEMKTDIANEIEANPTMLGVPGELIAAGTLNAASHATIFARDMSAKFSRKPAQTAESDSEEEKCAGPGLR